MRRLPPPRFKPYTHESFGQPHHVPDWWTDREDESPPTERATLQAQLRSVDVTLGRRHNESSSEAATRVIFDAMALRERLENLLAKKRGSVKSARQLLEGLDTLQSLSDENWEGKLKAATKTPTVGAEVRTPDGQIGVVISVTLDNFNSTTVRLRNGRIVGMDGKDATPTKAAR